MAKQKQTKLEGFMDFIREQGVVGLAVAFILGVAVTRVVSTLVDTTINPLLGFALGKVNLSAQKLVLVEATMQQNEVAIYWGQLVAVLIDFFVIAAVVYFGVKALGLDKLDKKK